MYYCPKCNPQSGRPVSGPVPSIAWCADHQPAPQPPRAAGPDGVDFNPSTLNYYIERPDQQDYRQAARPGYTRWVCGCGRRLKWTATVCPDCQENAA